MAEMNRIVTLDYARAIEAIKDTEYVYFRRGVWNKYEKIPTKQAAVRIQNSGYGADVKVDETGNFYVSCPCGSDMW